ncbi:MAG: FtsL-like putative cell division protein [Lentimicrobiaceae bacterium]|nr:FtsL-like putative cell division protein [Lentimicrobiaceae bacterium]
MANTLKQRKQEEEQVQPKEQVQKQPKPKANPPRTPRPIRKKGLKKGIKTVRKGFESIFGGGILQKINIRKNWGFILMVVVMMIVLIYSNLKTQSKRQLIHKLTQEVTLAKDEAMDAIEEGYNIDKQKEREILQEGEERGFTNSGYIPYIIEAETKSKNE